MTYTVDKDCLDEMIQYAKEVLSATEFADFIYECRENACVRKTYEYFNELFTELAENGEYCSKCGGELSVRIIEECHAELDGSPYESIGSGFVCERCDAIYE